MTFTQLIYVYLPTTVVAGLSKSRYNHNGGFHDVLMYRIERRRSAGPVVIVRRRYLCKDENDRFLKNRNRSVRNCW